ncbi:2S seed storage albumin protein-like [Solanum dulcamara]|uniref:2S seed storage albumin protein-like n=1 Tax=Solanum dulcamara TaxID=45834 RepID=UPI00248550EC|nr:2S seed storage albumin protein-like [Solanum dulcamara]
MGRVMIIGAISLAILFMAATVCSSRIMTITISEDAENPQTQSCQQQIQQAQQLRSCQEFLRQKVQYEDQQIPREVQQCCNQLEQIQDPQCRCEGLMQVVQQEEQTGQVQGRKKQQMLQTAQNLPGLCRLSPQRCEIQTLRTLF